MTDTWQLTSWDTRTEGDHDDVVVQTRWTLTVTDEDGDEGVFNGATPFSVDSEGDFIAFDELDEETVLGWITDCVDSIPGYRAHIDEQIAKAINEKKNPITTERPIPWNPEPEPEPEPVEPEEDD